jgi:hypothetical protein
MLLHTVYALALKAAEASVLAVTSFSSTETGCRARILPRHGKPAASPRDLAAVGCRGPIAEHNAMDLDWDLDC